jgi:hypothetical protein
VRQSAIRNQNHFLRNTRDYRRAATEVQRAAMATLQTKVAVEKIRGPHVKNSKSYEIKKPAIAGFFISRFLVKLTTAACAETTTHRE